MHVEHAIARDRRKPSTELLGCAQHRQPPQRLQEHVLDDVVGRGGVQAAQRDRVDHAGVASIELGKRVPVTLRGLFHKRRGIGRIVNNRRDFGPC